MNVSDKNEINGDNLECHSSKRIRRLESFVCLLFFLLCFDKIRLFQWKSSSIRVSDLRAVEEDIATLQNDQIILIHRYDQETEQSNNEIIKLREKINRIENELSEIARANSMELNDNNSAIPHQSNIPLMRPKEELSILTHNSNIDNMRGLRHQNQEHRMLPPTASLPQRSTVTSYEVEESDTIYTGESVERNLQMTLAGSTSPNIQRCSKLPILSPINEDNNFSHDERIRKILSTIHAISTADSLNQFFSPQYKAACWILFDDERMIEPHNPNVVQRYILALYLFATRRNAADFLPKNFCDYPDFYCDDSHHVTRIISELSDKTSTIPSELSNLRKLEYIDLSASGLRGTVPPAMGNLRNLKTLILDSNELTGHVPTALGLVENLTHLSLKQNFLVGTLPPQLGRLYNLEQLKLDQNELTGSIPTELFGCRNITQFFMFNNHFTGTIPSEIGQLGRVQNLYLENNVLHGTVPTEIGQLSNLLDLRLGLNQLTGSLPTEFANLSSLKSLVLKNNKFDGEIPDIFVRIDSFEVFNVAGNHLTGTVPESFWEAKFNLAVVISDNDITGTVPDDFCEKTKTVKVDNSNWFLDKPKVDCPCCDTASCYVWNQTEASGFKGIDRICPTKNLVEMEFEQRYWIDDLVAHMQHSHVAGFGAFKTNDVCLSPTGCYSLRDLNGELMNYNLSYSSSAQNLVKQDTCDAVEVCGSFYAPDHPRRAGLNHITQLAVPSTSVLEKPWLPAYKALCWIMTEDPIFDDFNICDGTLLQRFVMALFFHTQPQAFDFSTFSFQHTCEWPGVTCDVTHRYVEHLSLRNKGLTGTPNMRLGLLSRIISIDLNGNEFSGTLSPEFFIHVPNLEMFNIGNNTIRGRIPENLLQLPKLKGLNLGSNMITGVLPNYIAYSEDLEFFNVGNNMLNGKIPGSLLECKELIMIDLGLNSFTGSIPIALGTLEKLTLLRLHENMFTSTIPKQIFDAKLLEVLMLHTNKLTGSIPTEIGILERVRNVTLSYNSLRGTVPSELSYLKNIEYLHVHQNQLGGIVPQIHLMNPLVENAFIADCGNPFYALPEQMTCDSCTICCNSDNKCQQNLKWVANIDKYVLAAIFVPSVSLFIVIFIVFKMIKAKDRRELSDSEGMDSVYCFCFSSNLTAWFIHIFTSGVQFGLFIVFIQASNFLDENTAWQYSLRCPDNNMVCRNTNTVSGEGWFLFTVVTAFYLGTDFVNSILQIKKAVVTRDPKLIISGFVLLSLTSTAMFTSVLYNIAIASSNTDLIVNAVILLFINDLDEQFFSLLTSMFPNWVEERLEEVNKFIININAIAIVEDRALEAKERHASGRRMLGLSSFGHSNE